MQILMHMISTACSPSPLAYARSLVGSLARWTCSRDLRAVSALYSNTHRDRCKSHPEWRQLPDHHHSPVHHSTTSHSILLPALHQSYRHSLSVRTICT